MSNEPRIISIDITYAVVAALRESRDEDGEASDVRGMIRRVGAHGSHGD